jgi:hypothetical protein
MPPDNTEIGLDIDGIVNEALLETEYNDWIEENEQPTPAKEKRSLASVSIPG